MSVAIYTRVSTEEQALEGVSLEMQERRCRRFCVDRDMLDDVIVYTDEGVSGTTFDRPELQRMLEEIDQVDTVVVWKLDRLSRSVYDWAHMMEEFAQADVGLVSVTENFDCSSAIGRAMMGMIAIFAQLFVEIAAENIAAAVRHNVEQGKHHGRIPYGYDREDGELSIRDDEAQIIYRVFEEYIRGASYHDIARLANREQWEAGRIDGRWRPTRVMRLLQNSTYAGRVTNNDEEFPGLHEPIVPPEMYTQVQRRRRKRRRRRGSTPVTWAALYSCGICGGPMKNVGSGTNNEYRRYECARRKDVAQDERHRPNSVASTAADTIVRVWSRRLCDRSIVRQAVSAFEAQQAEDDDDGHERLEADLREVKRQIRDYHERVTAGTLPESMLAEMTEPLVERHDALMAELHAGADEPPSEVPDWLQAAAEGGLEAYLDSLPVERQIEHLRDLYAAIEVADTQVTFRHRVPMEPLTVDAPTWVRYDEMEPAVEDAIDEALDRQN